MPFPGFETTSISKKAANVAPVERNDTSRRRRRRRWAEARCCNIKLKIHFLWDPFQQFRLDLSIIFRLENNDTAEH